MKNMLATIGLFILYILYRIFMVPFVTDTIMTFKYWVEFSTKEDFIKPLSTIVFVSSWLIVGFWWTILGITTLVALNYLVYFIWKLWRKKA